MIQEDCSRSLAECLVLDIVKVLKEMDALPPRLTKVATVTAEPSHREGGEKDGVVIKKSERETQEEMTAYWRRYVQRKKTSGVW